MQLRTVLIIFHLNLQINITALMMSIEGESELVVTKLLAP